MFLCGSVYGGSCLRRTTRPETGNRRLTLGIALNLSSAEQYSEQYRVAMNYNLTPITTGATPDLRPMVLQQITFKDGPRQVDTFSASLTADFKASKELVLSLTTMFNSYLNNADARLVQYNFSTNNTNANTGRGRVLGDGIMDVRTSDGTTVNTGHTVGIPGSGAQKLTNTIMFLPGFEFKRGRLTIEGKGTYSKSREHRARHRPLGHGRSDRGELQRFAPGGGFARVDNHAAFRPGLVPPGELSEPAHHGGRSNERRPGTSPHRITGSLGYTYSRFTLRLGAVWTDDTPWTTTVTRYRKEKITTDLSGGFRISRRVTFFFQGRLIFNDPVEIFESVTSEHDRPVLQTYENYGANWVFGLKGTF